MVLAFLTELDFFKSYTWEKHWYFSNCNWFFAGLNPLHNASSFGHADVVRLLLEAGANPNTRDNWNYSPLHEAASKGKCDVCIGATSVALF